MKTLVTTITFPHVGYKSKMSVYSSMEKYYDIIYDQCFSPSGKHLITCDHFGHIAVFNLASSLGARDDVKTPTNTFNVSSGPLYCLEDISNHMIAGGGEDGIKLWKWDELTRNNKEVQPAMALQPPVWKLGTPETNGLAYDVKSNTMYSGCGDNNIHAWDINTGKLKSTFSGHTDYVHCVCMKNGTSHFVSGGEDGTVRIWDPSASSNPVHTIKPEKAVKGTSHWVGCVAMDPAGDWLVCGGSFSPTIYHLSTLSKVIAMDVPKEVVTQAAIFAKERIITAGSEPSVRHWSINGSPMAVIPNGHQHAFSLKFNFNNHQYEVLTSSGDSAEIDVFMNFGYKAFSLTLV